MDLTLWKLAGDHTRSCTEMVQMQREASPFLLESSDSSRFLKPRVQLSLMILTCLRAVVSPLWFSLIICSLHEPHQSSEPNSMQITCWRLSWLMTVSYCLCPCACTHWYTRVQWSEVPAGPLTAAMPMEKGATSNCETALAPESLT